MGNRSFGEIFKRGREMVNLLKAKSVFRKKGVTLISDKVKSGGGGSWKFAGEDNLLKTIQIPLIECGLEIIVTMEYNDNIGQYVKATLYHIDSGEHIDSIKKLTDVTPKKDRNGNTLYLDGEIEVGKQFGYWSRILIMRLLGISDIDPETLEKNAPEEYDENEAENKKLISSYLDDIQNSEEKEKLLDFMWATYGIRKVSELSNTQAKKFIIALNKKYGKL